MPAVKSGTTIINVSGAGNTLATITADIADAAWIADLGGGVYELKASRTIRLLAGATFTIGDLNDYTVYQKLQYAPTVANYTFLDVAAGSTFNMVGNTVIDCTTSATYYGTIGIQGKVFIDGDGVNNPFIDTWNSIAFSKTSASSAAQLATDTWWVNNVLLGNSFGSGAVGFQFVLDRGLPNPDNYIFKNITIDTDVAATNCFVTSRDGLYLSQYLTFENITITGAGKISYPFRMGPHTYIKDCDFLGDSVAAVLHQSVALSIPGIAKFNNSPGPDLSVGYNPYPGWQMLDGCTISPSVGETYGIACYGSTIVKDCTFGNVSTRVYQGTSARAQTIFMGTIDFGGNWTPSATGIPGGWFWGCLLDLTIVNPAGSPIEGAIIDIVQSEGRERYQYITDSTGRPIQKYGLGKKIPLIYKEWVSGDIVTGTYSAWSTAASNTYHTVRVSKKGYNSVSFDVVMEANVTKTVTLSEFSGEFGAE